MTQTAARASSWTYNLDAALGEYEHWRTREAGYSLKTWAGEKPGLLAFVDCMLDLDDPAIQTRQLTPEHLSQWWECTDHLADSTRVTRLAQLRAFLGYCIKRGWLDSDPSLLLRAARPIPRQRDRLVAGELLELPEHTTGLRDRALVALATNLALRGGEIARLCIGDVNLRAHELRVTVPKTRQADVMPLTSDLAVELSRWLSHYTAMCSALTQRSYLIPSQYVDNTRNRVIYRPDKPVSKPERVIQRALTELGWGDVKGEGVHTIRRSVARVYFDMIEDEESFDSALLATMTLLHHQRSETTLRYIGRDRATMARDRVMKGKPFLSKLAPGHLLRVVG